MYAIENLANKIHAYGMPLDFNALQQYSGEKEEKIILFPHRPNIEKNPHIYISIIQGLSMFWDDFDKYKFVFCTSKEDYQSESIWINALLARLLKEHKNVEVWANLTKEEYYRLAAKSTVVVSTTSEENFGYCAVEALALGTKILAPNSFSHPEIVEENQMFLYEDYDDSLAKIPLIAKQEISVSEIKQYVEPYKDVIRDWLKKMGA